MGKYSFTEESPIAGRPGTHNLKNTWESERYELGFLTGYGLGPVWPLAGLDASIYVPIAARNYQLTGYLVTDDPADNRAAYGQGSLHGSEKSGKSGTGIGDIQLNTLALLYADSDAGFWSCGSLRLSLPSGSSAAEKFIRIYHGEPTTPGAGDGVMRLVPGLSALKMVAGQRVTLALEYGLPLGTNRFAFNAPETWWSVPQGGLAGRHPSGYRGCGGLVQHIRRDALRGVQLPAVFSGEVAREVERRALDGGDRTAHAPRRRDRSVLPGPHPGVCHQRGVGHCGAALEAGH